MSFEIYTIDAFADRPFTGNPAAVCFADEGVDPAWMQSVAAEMNLSETAFVWNEGEGYRLRWFTPGMEVDLCGHATLATAHALWETRRLDLDSRARFWTRSGELRARRVEEGIEMDFPSQEAAVCEHIPARLLESLGCEAESVWFNSSDYLVEVRSERDVRELGPDFRALAKVQCRGVMVTAAADAADIDFVSRFFAPVAGVDEDPVTGSAHCCLAPFWATRFGRDELVGYQCSARGGRVRTRVEGDRVKLVGQATTVLRGRIGDEDVNEPRQKYTARMEGQLNEWGARIDGLMSRVESSARSGFDRLSGDLKDKQGVAQTRLRDLKSSGSSAWEDLKPGVESAWKDLKVAVERASAHFRNS